VTPEEFVTDLDLRTRTLLDRLAAGATQGPPPELAIAELLKLALKNELEAAELAAAWMTDTPELDAKLALARQCGDEARHYRYIEERLRELGEDPAGYDPTAGGPSPLYQRLLGLRTTAERAAAGQYAREAIAVLRNEVFATLCEQRGDGKTAALYRERIQPDERHHQELGRRLLLRYATTPEAQERARAAAEATLHTAEEVQDLLRLRRGISRAPGC
jgi:1,2-phenylacetyl-CoA epoxidase catalytic subunit